MFLQISTNNLFSGHKNKQTALRSQDALPEERLEFKMVVRNPEAQRASLFVLTVVCCLPRAWMKATKI